MPPPELEKSGEYDPWSAFRQQVIGDVTGLETKHEKVIERLATLEANDKNAKDEKQAMWNRLEKYESECKDRQKHFEEGLAIRLDRLAATRKSPTPAAPAQHIPEPSMMQRSAPYAVPAGVAGSLYAVLELVKALGAS